MRSIQQQHLPNKTLFNSYERLLLGTLNFGHRIEVKHLRSEHKNLTLTNIKPGMNFGRLVVPFDQTRHPLHIIIFYPFKF